MGNRQEKQVSTTDLIGDSFGPSGAALVRMAVSALLFGLVFFVTRRLIDNV